jgi:hypothetical protein
VTRAAVRAYAIRWLRGRRVGSAPYYKGLGRPGCVNFDCGCSIFAGHTRGWGQSRRQTVVCADHQRHLGDGSTL